MFHALTDTLRYDARRRLWIAGQRVHHGLTGVLHARHRLMLHDWRTVAAVPARPDMQP